MSISCPSPSLLVRNNRRYGNLPDTEVFLNPLCQLGLGDEVPRRLVSGTVYPTTNQEIYKSLLKRGTGLGAPLTMTFFPLSSVRAGRSRSGRTMSDLIIVKMIIYRVLVQYRIWMVAMENHDTIYFRTGAVPRTGEGGCVHGFR